MQNVNVYFCKLGTLWSGLRQRLTCRKSIRKSSGKGWKRVSKGKMWAMMGRNKDLIWPYGEPRNWDGPSNVPQIEARGPGLDAAAVVMISSGKRMLHLSSAKVISKEGWQLRTLSQHLGVGGTIPSFLNWDLDGILAHPPNFATFPASFPLFILLLISGDIPLIKC